MHGIETESQELVRTQAAIHRSGAFLFSNMWWGRSFHVWLDSRTDTASDRHGREDGIRSEGAYLRKAVILRGASTDQGTPGQFIADGYRCLTTELPWRDNLPQLSCIPVGVYKAVWAKSPKFGWCYHVTGVPGRGDILMHPGNFAGDVKLLYKSHSHGCILPCKRRGKMDGQMAGLLSAIAVRGIADAMKREDFLLEIKNA
ncbi:MAG TPA: DUF5675 family protein [Candidatus Paceibacterota bacterium]